MWPALLKELCGTVLQWHPLVAQLPEVPVAQLAIFVPVQHAKPILKRETKEDKWNSGKGPVDSVYYVNKLV